MKRVRYANYQDHSRADRFQPGIGARPRVRSGIADRFGASLHMIHGVEHPFLPGSFMETYPGLPADYFDSLEKAARERLEAQLSPDETAKYSAIFVTRIGVPAREVLDYLAAHAEIDLVVMATAGRGAIGRLVMGSVVDKIVRAAPCPVLTVHAPDHSQSDAPPRAA